MPWINQVFETEFGNVLAIWNTLSLWLKTVEDRSISRIQFTLLDSLDNEFPWLILLLNLPIAVRK